MYQLYLNLLSSLLIFTVSPDSVSANLDTMVVTDSRSVKNISTSFQQQRFGLSDDISKLLYLQPGVDRLPETGSAMLVRGCGLYDNLFTIAGVPMLNPVHFGLHSFADRTGTIFSSIENVKFITDGAGEYCDAPGGLTVIEPSIPRLTEGKLNILGNIGILDWETLLSAPLRNGDDLVQIGIRKSNELMMRWKNSAWGNGNSPLSPFVFSDSAKLGYSPPGSFYDICLTTLHKIHSSKLKNHIWYALDSYEASGNRDEKHIHWGLFSSTLELQNRTLLREITIGGSSQQFFEGKKYGPVIPLKEVKRENLILSGEMRPWEWESTGLDIHSAFSVEAMKWDGKLTFDSSRSINREVYEDYRSGETEFRGTLSTGLKGGKPPFFFGTDILSCINGPGIDIFFDPRIWCSYSGTWFQYTGSIGAMSSFPDIRGLPDSSYRHDKYMTYSQLNDLKFSFFNGLISFTAQTHVRYSGEYPAFSDIPGKIMWDPDCETRFISAGAGLFAEINRKNIGFSTFQNIGKSYRLVKNTRYPFEYDIPWSNKSVLRLSTTSGRVNLFLYGYFAAGLPFRDLEMKNEELVFSEKIKRVKAYKRLDSKIEFFNKIDHPFIDHCNLYIDFLNLANAFEGRLGPKNASKWYWENDREYYWNDTLQRQSIQVEKATIAFGLKLGLKLF